MRRAGSSIAPACFMLRARSMQNRACRIDLRIHSPPADARTERPTPWLLVQGELQTSACWNQAVRYLTAKGCTVATLEHRQDLSKMSLAELEGDMVEAVQGLAAIAPVIVAQSFMGFVAQKFLESHAASGLILVNAIPPFPAQCIQGYVSLLGMSVGPEGSINGPLDPDVVEMLYGEGLKSDQLDKYFPRKALEEACTPQSAVRLEPHSVPMLVLGCEHDPVVTKEEVHATAEFHGVEPQDVHLCSWQSHALPRNKAAQQQLIDRMYEWYDANY